MTLAIKTTRLFFSPSTFIGLFHPYSTSTEVPVNVPEPVLSSKNLAQFKKGSGGRASFSGNVVTVFGTTGCTGTAVVNRLAKQGNQIIIPYRCDPYFVKEHKVVGELGQILFFPFNLKNEDDIRKSVKYSNVVINLIGSFIDTPNFTMHDTNVEGARRIARICREMGVERLVHVSALNADPDYKTKSIKNGQFLKTKGLGELAVLEEFPNATIVKPALIYAEIDHFIVKMLSPCRRMPITGWVYVYNKGQGFYKMPHYVNDFALAVARIAADPATAGKIFELVGPHCYELCELLDYMYKKAGCMEETGYNYKRGGTPNIWFLAASFICHMNTKIYRSSRSWIHWEWMDYAEATSDVITGENTLGYKDLGMTPQEFENKGGWLCTQWAFSNPLELQYGEKPEPPLPLRSPPLYKHVPKPFKLDQIKTERRVFGLG